MKLTFRIPYHTVWGETVRVILENEVEVELYTLDGQVWKGDCDYHPTDSIAPTDSTTAICYRYAIYRNDTCVRKELGAIPHSFYPGNVLQSHYILNDAWRDLPLKAYKYSSAFNGIYQREMPRWLQENVESCVTFRALCPGLRQKKQALGIIGSCSVLGQWDPKRARRLHEVQPNVWHLTLDATRLMAQSPFDYKFVAINTVTGAIEEWEVGANRFFQIQPLQKGETYLPAETEVYFDQAEQKIAGTAIPVFSLRSEGSYGVGDFGDLKTFIGWAADTHQRAVQILPINDTTMSHTWTDSYPYSSISIYAFHPMYVDLRQLPALKDKSASMNFERKRLMLNALPQVDYEEVNNCKRAYIRAVYQQEEKNILADKRFQTFLDENKEWLQPYAAFRYLTARFKTADFHKWGAYSTYSKELVDTLCSPKGEHYSDIAVYYYTQFLLHVQLLDATTYGRSRGILVKGDIPIGISRTSVEAWVEPYYFNMNGQAGAPPDAFSVNGQNWGMPTYNWEVMAKDNYQWWQRRFRKMAEYFTAYRIDHILGFFRIWEIPYHSVHGLLGQFVPSLPMDADEIKGFGLNFRQEFMTRPFISEYILNSQFGEQAELVRQTFVQPLHSDLYQMRPEFDTQRKVEAYFAGKTDAASLELKEKLYALISDVLFIPDRDNPEKFHPRIAVQNDFVYQQLTDHEKEAFNRLYNHYYYQRHNDFWYKEAMKKLPILTQCTDMLVCGEDLGMVPDCVPWVMSQLQILSLEIQRMPKDPKVEFGKVYGYPFLSVCTIGTHDMSTFRGWWEEDRKLSERFYYNELGHWGNFPEKAPGWLCEETVRQHLNSPSMLCILTWQDWLGMDEKLRNPDVDQERINVPANPRHYWRWRMHLTLEDLMKQKAFNEKIRVMIDGSGR